MRLISTSTDKELRCQVGFNNISRGVCWLSDIVLDEVEGVLVQDSEELMCCVLEQDTLSSASYWFNPERQGNCPDRTEKLLTGT